MNRFLVLSLVAFAAVAVAFVAGSNSNAQIRTEVQSDNVPKFEYAQLMVTDDGFLWLQGELNLTPRPVTIEALAQKLEQRGGRKTFENLLNTVGSNGWELVFIDGGATTRYTFKRPYVE